jgi:hypothetical protein
LDEIRERVAALIEHHLQSAIVLRP